MSPSHPLFWLLIATLLIAIGFAGWSWLSARQSQKTGGHTKGIGGPNDPLAEPPGRLAFG